MMFYIAAEVYDKEALKILSENMNIEGIVIGDGYCQKRMFPFGESELTEFAIFAHELGLKVIFQTQCYMTERIFDKTRSIVRYLWDRKICDTVLVQDVGLSADLKKEIPNLKLIWSQLGRARNGAENLLFYKFLKKTGVFGVELIRPEFAGYLKEIGLVPVYVDKQLMYGTVNRECYYIHELGIPDHGCNRECLSREARMVNEKRQMELKIDGYMLNRSYTDVDLSCVSPENNIILLRGKDTAEIISHLSSAWR